MRRSGIRSIDAVVDITNYVMIELGQPMHAFDREQLVGAVDVRMARNGEELVLLDGKKLTLTEDVLVIADQEAPLALAGIMGGERSGISEKTTTVFLESAYFNPSLSQERLVVLASTRMHQRVLNVGLIGDWLSEQANVRQILYSKFVEELRGQSLSPKTSMPCLKHRRLSFHIPGSSSSLGFLFHRQRFNRCLELSDSR